MSEPIISVSRLRGTIPDQLTPLVAIRYVAALAATLPKGSVVISRDGRASGNMLAHAITSALVGHGLNVLDIGVAATPTVGVQVRKLNAVAGIQISASHNPKEYNGLKLFGSDGRVVNKSKGESILDGYRMAHANWSPVDQLGSNDSLSDPHSEHLSLVLATTDVETIRKNSFRVLLDSNRGSGSALGRRLLSVALLQGQTRDSGLRSQRWRIRLLSATMNLDLREDLINLDLREDLWSAPASSNPISLCDLSFGNDPASHRRRFRRLNPVSVDEIISVTASQFSVSPDDYVGFRSGAAGRDLAAFLCRRFTRATLRELSARFGLSHPDSVSDLIR